MRRFIYKIIKRLSCQSANNYEKINACAYKLNHWMSVWANWRLLKKACLLETLSVVIVCLWFLARILPKFRQGMQELQEPTAVEVASTLPEFQQKEHSGPLLGQTWSKYQWPESLSQLGTAHQYTTRPSRKPNRKCKLKL